MTNILRRVVRNLGFRLADDGAPKNTDDSVHGIAHLRSLVPSAINQGPEAIATLSQALYQAGLEQLGTGFPAQAALALSTATDLGCDAPELDYNLALAYSRSGQAQLAHAYFEKAQTGPVKDAEGDGFYLRNAYALETISLDDLRRMAKGWADRHVTDVKPYRDEALSPTKQTLRVGLMSARFCRHAVGYLTLAGLEKVSVEKVEFFLYANNSPNDDYTERFKSLATAWHDTHELDDVAVAKLIRSHQIDILIDMAGHSAGGQMGVLARKPAPIQAKWAGGQHGTTGLSAIDYFITDLVETPLDQGPYFVEKPIRLPNAYACYSPPSDTPSVHALPWTKNGYVTFGCFNNISKLSEGTFSAWAEILSAVSDSRLVLKHFALGEPETRDRVAAQFSALGISSDRIDLRAPTNHTSHLEAYGEIDIALDSFPWSGCVTTCESLWMGVPVLTLPGIAFCHRHSVSFLSAIGLDGWISENQDDYVSKAIAIAQNPKALVPLRLELRARVAASPLCNAKQFARDFESMLFEMHRGKAKT
ncbi:MAG: hypothetical protein HOL61_09650 [Rhodospirillaceae bacterium]|jgi:protein O-GlcNAc transferase|nr:hypothetical protein [Rhodospirillaceae bacterium]MBT6962420.1 hypothetical protein [Rhodospirillaceae bacterium]